jgi:hypothetical protein
MVMGIQPIQILEFPKLRGKEAIQALNAFITELEEQRGQELTDKQTNALIKFSSGLISSIEAQNQSNRIANKLEQMKEEKRLIPRLKRRFQNTFLNTLPL